MLAYKTKVVAYRNAYGHTHVPMYEQQIAVACSGGADSSLLLWMLVSNGFIPRIFFLKDANAKYEALVNVVDNLNHRFKTKMEIERFDRVSKGHFIKPDIMMMQDHIQYLYDGITRNPPQEVQLEGLYPVRPVTNRNPRFITPFLKFDKRFVLAVYRQKNLEWLYDQTWSCTENISIPCNRCFACSERNWAYAEVYNE